MTGDSDSATVIELPAQLDMPTVHRIVSEDLPYGMWVCDARGRIVYLSRSFLDLVGMTLEECRRSGWSSRLPRDRMERTLTDWRRCVASGTQWDYEHLILGVDGDYHAVHSRGLPVRNGTGDVLAWVGVNLDITERKRFEDELANLLHDLGRVASSADTNYVGDGLQVVATRACEAAQAFFDCDSVSLWRRSGQALFLDARVPADGAERDDLDLVSRPETWDELANLRPVLVGQGGRMPDAAEHACLSRSGVRTQLRLPVSIDSRADAFFALDWHRLGPVLASRTLALAEDFATRTEAVMADVWRRGERRQRALEINDKVIQALVRARGAFDFQSPGDLDRALADALDAARQVIGHLLTAEGGTGFAPGQLVRAKTGAGAVGTVSPSTSTSTFTAREHVRVLLVDDESSYRALLRHTLHAERCFAVVGEASDGAEAVSLASSVPADVIVLDLSMPSMDGLEAIRLLRERVPQVKILALSGFSAEHVRASVLEQGADAYLEKGGPIEEVVHVLTQMVSPPGG